MQVVYLKRSVDADKQHADEPLMLITAFHTNGSREVQEHFFITAYC